jgi:hypothetical protein
VFNVPNSNSLIQTLENIKIGGNTKVRSFDIVNMYTNIPNTEARDIIKYFLKYYYCMKDEDKKELLILLNTILEQNYLQFNNQFFKQNCDLAAGAPTSAVLAQILCNTSNIQQSIKS